MAADRSLTIAVNAAQLSAIVQSRGGVKRSRGAIYYDIRDNDKLHGLGVRFIYTRLPNGRIARLLDVLMVPAYLKWLGLPLEHCRLLSRSEMVTAGAILTDPSVDVAVTDPGPASPTRPSARAIPAAQSPATA